MHKIQLIGISGDARYDTLQRNLLSVVEKLSLPMDVIEVNDIDKMIEHQLYAIPAIAINGTVVLVQNDHIPSEDEITSVIHNYFSKHSLDMKNILVPVDFSETAKNAYRYARKLAEAQDSDLNVVHFCHPTIDTESSFYVPDMQTLVAEKKKKLKEFVQLDTTSTITTAVADAMVEQEVVLGFAEEEIVKRSSEEGTDLILMGTTGSSNILTKLFGSISSSVAQNADCPVWLVPPNAEFKGINKILYAGNYESANRPMMQQIMNLAEKFDAEIQLLHVIDDSQSGKDQDMEALFLETLFKKVAPSLDYILHIAKQGDIGKTLFNQAEQQDADLIVLVTRHRSLWNKWFHKSTTRAMVLNAKTPLLVLHDLSS